MPRMTRRYNFVIITISLIFLLPSSLSITYVSPAAARNKVIIYIILSSREAKRETMMLYIRLAAMVKKKMQEFSVSARIR